MKRQIIDIVFLPFTPTRSSGAVAFGVHVLDAEYFIAGVSGRCNFTLRRGHTSPNSLKLHISQIVLDARPEKFDNAALPEKRTEQISPIDEPYGYRRTLLAGFPRASWPVASPHRVVVNREPGSESNSRLRDDHGRFNRSSNQTLIKD